MKIKFNIFPALAIVAIALVALAAACEGGAPENLTFDLEIHDGRLNIEGGVIRVKQGDTVTINFVSDVAGELHLHGYDVLHDVSPDASSSLQVVADATGSFDITLHVTANEGEEGEESAPEEHVEGHDEGGDHEEEEIDLGSLQVFPR